MKEPKWNVNEKLATWKHAAILPKILEPAVTSPWVLVQHKALQVGQRKENFLFKAPIETKRKIYSWNIIPLAAFKALIPCMARMPVLRL